MGSIQGTGRRFPAERSAISLGVSPSIAARPSFIGVFTGAAGGIVLLGLMAMVMPPLALIPVHTVVMLGAGVTRTMIMWRNVMRPTLLPFVIGSLIGAALGLPLGIFLAALVTSALSQYDLRFALPYDQLIVLSVVAVIAGLLAAITPARRAARLNPLEALQYE